ncbi:DNA sulfur modification protein DndD [Chryseobacterium sp. WG14]|uniref:AAA family ATPase n=1 Tax=Chryseobacterium sp. WG14 TaxID=2926909 RepID=UPI00211EBD99|nr:DNA sulfur modification protein DndD [Chryseobacterium sp. WG14]MCQ9637917.1 DNA sulfur modification protein DndD [Chryseobacterium sp. WG14]
MKIRKIKFNNFRIYKGENEINFSSSNSSKNINIVAGKNGFGKTTFLTSLIWCFYGKMMVEVEEKYKRDIRNSGGYENFLLTLLNRDIKTEFEENKNINPVLSMEIELEDLSIPSMPSESVLIKRSFNLKNGIEDVEILIDGVENELTKEVGYEVFINDFILPREIAKFFFFDAEKIVTLAEAKSKSELKNLSKAYSEVLGIKKYEDLKKNLETLLIKLRRNGAKPHQQEKLQELLDKETEIQELITISQSKRDEIEKEISLNTQQSEALQEKLIREGNGITVEELKELKDEYHNLKVKSDEIKGRLKKMLDIVPIVLAGKKLIELENQIDNEKASNNPLNIDLISNLKLYQSIIEKLKELGIENKKSKQVVQTIQDTLGSFNTSKENGTKVLLDFSSEQRREIKAVIDNIKGGFSIQFQDIVKEEKNNRLAISRVFHKIKQAEARKDNAVAEKLREEKSKSDKKIIALSEEKGALNEEIATLETQLTSNHKILSEFEKNFKLIEADLAKSEVTQNLLDKINVIIKRIKEDKKYSLQKSILLGLKKLMHKNNFIRNVKVNVQDDIMDIDLLDVNNNIIDKESLSKGEQQLYATALLKALVDESGIKFPVFIDSPLQKFDKFHSQNIIKEFYPSISEQVVLFPLLEKELSEIEYEYLKPYLNKVHMIDNVEGASSLKSFKIDQLFNEFKKDSNYVHSN